MGWHCLHCLKEGHGEVGVSLQGLLASLPRARTEALLILRTGFPSCLCSGPSKLGPRLCSLPTVSCALVTLGLTTVHDMPSKGHSHESSKGLCCSVGSASCPGLSTPDFSFHLSCGTAEISGLPKLCSPSETPVLS